MGRKRGPPPLELPPPKDVAAWARMLAAARGAEMIDNGRTRLINRDPLILARLAALFPITRLLYDEKVLRIAKTESERIASIIAHCKRSPDANKPRPLNSSTNHQPPPAWFTITCRRKLSKLLVPATPRTLRPAPPDAIGFHLTPNSSPWRPLRTALKRGLSAAEKRQSTLYNQRINNAIRHHQVDRSTLQPLRNHSLVDAVLDRAPPLIRFLPPQWTATDKAGRLIDALLALLELERTRPFVDLIGALSESEYDFLVKEHECLSQILDGRDWAPGCTEGRNISDYITLVRHLRDGCGFKGPLSVVPLQQDLRLKTSKFRPDRVSSRHTLQVPAQSDIIAWALLLAAARGADMMQTDGLPENEAHPLIKSRLPALLPVANELYETIVGPIARNESRHIEDILVHCRAFLGAIDPVYRELGIYRKLRLAKPWNRTLCDKAAHSLVVPATLKSLRPAPPDAIGVHLTPKSSVWHLLRMEINRGLSEADKLLGKRYNKHRRDALRFGPIHQSKPLQNVSLVAAILARAPPLVQTLPPQWTAANSTNELIEALLALLELEHTRPLIDLVIALSDVEYGLLAKEHLCLSQVLDGRGWASICAQGRSLKEYVAFARFLRQDGKFTGLKDLAAKRKVQTSRLKRQESERSVMLRLAAVKRRQALQVPPLTDTAAWARMLAAARGADMIQTDGMEAILAHPLTGLRLRTLLPVANELYEKLVLNRIAIPEWRRIGDILEHCQEFLGAVESRLPDLDTSEEQRPEKPWNITQCQDAAGNLFVPATLKTVRLTPPDVIGLHLTPPSSAWRLLRALINRGLSDADKRLGKSFNQHMRNAISWRHVDPSKLQLLRNESFVDAVLERAPPLVKILPPQWTSPDKTNKLLDAQLALLELGPTRPLADLVVALSQAEYDLLVKEHACLSQIFGGGDWAPICALGRSIDDYRTLLLFLRQDGKFTGRLAAVPAKLRNVKLEGRKRKWSTGETLLPLAARKRQRASSIDSTDKDESSVPEDEMYDFDEVSDESMDWLPHVPHMLSELENDVGVVHRLESKSWSAFGGHLALSDNSAARSGVSVVPLAVAGAAFGLVVFLLAVVFRQRVWRILGSDSRARFAVQR